MRFILQNDVSTINYMDIGRQIQRRRKLVGLTQEQLANKANLETPTISKIENGRTKISLPSLIQIANALEISADELLCGSLITSGIIYQGKIMEQLKTCDEKELRIVERMVGCLLQQLRETYNAARDE